MATSITLQQDRGVVAAGSPEETAGGTVGQYFVRNTITAANDDTGPSSDFDKNFFLFKRDGNVYQHVCTVGDLEAWSETDPNSGTDEYYRYLEALLFFDTLDDAWDAANLVKTRLQYLADDWENYINNPGGSFSVTDEETTFTAP